MCETSRVLLERFLTARRRIAAEHAQMLTLLAEFAALDRDELNPDGEYSHLEIAAVAGVSERYARCLLDLAETVTTRLPGTLAALRAGETDLHRVQRIAEATDVLSDELAAQVEAELLTGLAEWSPRQLNYRLRKAVDRADPQAAQARAVARQEARVSRTPASTTAPACCGSRAMWNAPSSPISVFGVSRNSSRQRVTPVRLIRSPRTSRWTAWQARGSNTPRCMSG